MKLMYSKSERSQRSNLSVFVLVCLMIMVAIPVSIQAQQTYTFTTAGASSSLGPTQAQINNAYALTSLSNAVVSNAGIQTWTVPISGLYLIDATGAEGGFSQNGSKSGGLGARMRGEFVLNAGGTVQVVVGHKGEDGCGNAGGGGGSYVVYNGTLLLASGGGGGASSDQNGVHATTVTAGTQDSGNLFAGGTNGDGGQACTGGTYGGGGGGGFNFGNSGNGVDAGQGGGGGKSFLNGSTGGAAYPAANSPAGGFGGGGGGRTCTVGGGGGGGYSGGAGGQHINTCFQAPRTGGGGGGSYNSGTNQVNTATVQAGNGRVIFTSLCYLSVYSSSNPMCAGNTITITTDAISNYSWSTGSTASSIVVSPSVTTTYSIAATSSMNCNTNSAITITVSPGVPVLSVVSTTNNVCLGQNVTFTASGALTYTWSDGISNGVPFTPTTTATYTVNGQNGCGITSAVTTVTVAPLAVSVQNTPTIACAGLPTTLTAMAAATNFSWQPFGLTGSLVVVNPTVNTVFTVTATDGTCSGVQTISLSPLPVPTINVVSNASVVCAGFPVNMSASGGITYTWLPGNMNGNSVTVYPTGPTLYTVNGSNSVGCVTGTTQIVLTDPSPAVNIIASPTLICAGDQVNLVASGNAAGYQWTNGPSVPSFTVSPTVTSIYTVTGSSSNNTCTTTKTIAINVFNPVLTLSASSNTVCSGSSVTLSASGAETYFWNTGAFEPNVVVTPTATSVYSVSATSTTINALTCTVDGTITVSVNPNPAVTASSNRTLICKGESTDLNASGAVNYTWSTGSNSMSTTVNPSLVTIHTYTIVGSDNNGCMGQNTILIRVVACNGIADASAVTGNLNVYPNPAQGEFTIESEINGTLTLSNQLGQVIRRIDTGGKAGTKIVVRGLEPGLYFLTGSNGQAIKIVTE